ncbi:MAG TPA: bifunctional ornithine acetyltransferase/N-acetylglutamate synthase, partial [Candidatus Thermoplasmatota archaeon]|nr:bifunctional ornithine acetyltransferase/N-acetylglutamate synthase [Candidatus Thermoplasmatota archaeon]
AAARAVTRSNLVKTAVHGKDPNWGRIFAAAGCSGAKFDPNVADLYIGTDASRAKVVENGVPVEGVDYADISRWMGGEKVVFVVDLKAGGASATAWGCDMGEEYVKINASYTT